MNLNINACLDGMRREIKIVKFMFKKKKTIIANLKNQFFNLQHMLKKNTDKKKKISALAFISMVEQLLASTKRTYIEIP